MIKLSPKSKTAFATFSLFITSIVIYYLYNHPMLYPLRMVIVSLHESSHAIAILLTGGEISGFTMLPNEGGSVNARGGNMILAAMSGYLGSLLIGLFLFYFSSVSKKDKYAFLVLAMWMAPFTLFYFSDQFTLIFGIVVSLVFTGIYLINSHIFSDLVLKLLGLFSIIYVPHDIYSDTISRSHLKSDAYFMAQNIGFTTEIWGWIWMILSLIFIFISMKLTINAMHNINMQNQENQIKDNGQS